jgi:hypothetical protein
MRTTYQPDAYTPEIKNWKPGIARMTSYLDVNEKAYWLLQVHLTPYNASKAGLKYDPLKWTGRPLIRVVWVNRDGHLAEFQEWLEHGEEVQVPCVWELSVAEAIDAADAYSAIGSQQTTEWLLQAQAESTLISDSIEWEFQKTEMAQNRSVFGPGGAIQRNGFPHELRRRKLRESSMRWNQ